MIQLPKYTKRIIIGCICVFMTGCATNMTKCDPVVTVDYKYVTKMPPAELLTLPDKVAKLDTETATQADVAKFIVELDKRQRLLETKIIGIVEFLKKD